MRKIHIFGDSHSDNTFKDIEVKYPIKINHIGPITAHKVGRDKINMLELSDVKNNDICIFCFGEIDARCHVGKQINELGRKEDEVLLDLVTRYFDTLKKNFVEGVSQNKTLHFFVMSILPPPYNDVFASKTYPFVGSELERRSWVIKLNGLMKRECEKNNFGYFDVHSLYKDNNEMLVRDLSDGYVHIRDRKLVKMYLDHLLANFKDEPKQKKIFTFGDFHAVSSFQNVSCPYPIQMNYLGKDNAVSMGEFSQKNYLDITKFGVEEDDICVFHFGETDVRSIFHSKDVNKEDMDLVVNSLCKSYIDSVLENKSKYKKLTCTIMSVIPPAHKEFSTENKAVPFNGSDQKRAEWTRMLNTRLRKMCVAHNLDYLDIYALYVDSDGMLERRFKDDHVSIKNTELVSFEIKRYLEMLGFNGDYFVQREIKKIVNTFKITHAIETGTHLGFSTYFLSNYIDYVNTIEYVNEHLLKAVGNLRKRNNVGLHEGDSPIVIEQILKNSKSELKIFYLDAHWQEEFWPLLNEIKVIGKYLFDNAIIVIDDFFVPNRSYNFDRYRGQPNNLEFIKEALTHAYSEYVYYYNDRADRWEFGQKGNPVGKIYIFPKKIFKEYGLIETDFYKLDNGVPYSIL
jgi:hypothetical protein